VDANQDVKFLPIADGPSGRLAALSSGVINTTRFTPPTDMLAQRSGMKILSKIDAENVGGGMSTMKQRFRTGEQCWVDFSRVISKGFTI
jgi:hypothetical protein